VTTELEIFHQELFDDEHIFEEPESRSAEDAFFDLFCDYIVESGELVTADRVRFDARRGMRIDGYGGSPVEADGSLSLIIADYNHSGAVKTLTRTEMDAHFQRLTTFFMRASDDAFRDSLAGNEEALGLVDSIQSTWLSVSKIRMILITNKILSTRVDGRDADAIGDIPVTYSVWDLSRLQRYATSGNEREDIKIDLVSEFGTSLPALPAHLPGAGYEAYLVTIPGNYLATIYDRWQARLLEQNVRVFLQSRTIVNRGIRNTLENNPEMFFAYNNGITATAEKIETIESSGGLQITSMTNFQIVNGGQTTASIHAAGIRRKKDLSKVFVPMKLSVIQRDVANEVVPNISRFANTQNRVTSADFFSNHPYHVRMEGFSRRLYAPAADGSFKDSTWFYERARGQYRDARAHLTNAQKIQFDLENPKRQSFSKTDLAKFVNVWLMKPDIVSRGAQINFNEFAKYIDAAWTRSDRGFNEMHYRDCIAKAIIFRQVEKMVSAQEWYEGGYRANIVAYTIAKLALDVSERGDEIDFNAVWRRQDLPPDLRESLTVGAKVVNDILSDPPPSERNISEWAKKKSAWDVIQELEVDWPNSLQKCLVSKVQQNDMRRDAKKDQKVLNDIEAQFAVIEAGGPFWKGLMTWGIDNKLLGPTDERALTVAAALPDKLPDEKQSIRIIAVLKRLQEQGCPIKNPPSIT